ncbi:MAG: hypothetical protein KAW56_08610 [Candidatus Marinimicrobia bacterium]|nr:hypothetical protein [Candidatus Neomarinimicrobiota bacterium]
MKPAVQKTLINMKDFLLSHSGLEEYLKQNGEDKFRRTFNLFRSDLMRLNPENVSCYFSNDQLSITEIKSNPPTEEGQEEQQNFLADLSMRYFNNSNDENDDRIRENLEALIYACLEIDAAVKFKKMPTDKREGLEKLNLWELS